MSLSHMINIAGSGMSAQSIRLNTTASNIANAQTVSSSVDTTYRARKPIFQAVHAPLVQQRLADRPLTEQAGQGVRVAAIVEKPGPLELRYEPTHPFADEQGYVSYPNVNVVEEMADMLSASRSFQVNVELFETAKTLLNKTLNMNK